jgi:hypothetical protein
MHAMKAHGRVAIWFQLVLTSEENVHHHVPAALSTQKATLIRTEYEDRWPKIRYWNCREPNRVISVAQPKTQSDHEIPTAVVYH